MRMPDTEGGGGFNPRKRPTKLKSALAPEEKPGTS